MGEKLFVSMENRLKKMLLTPKSSSSPNDGEADLPF